MNFNEITRYRGNHPPYVHRAAPKKRKPPPNPNPPLHPKTPEQRERMNIDKILKKYNLNLKEEMFCRYFTSPSEFYGNGIQAYSVAFDYDITSPRNYAIAKSKAASLLSNIRLIPRINDLLDGGGFNDLNIDKQLLHVINQNAEYASKVAGIREYNKLKKRIDNKMILELPVTRIRVEGVEPPTHVEHTEIDGNITNGGNEDA